MNKTAMFYTKFDDYVQCDLCPHYCKLSDNQISMCKSRKSDGNKLIVLNYGKLTSLHYDPIEKKPLYHFYPGSETLSIGTYGCNFTCKFCQNHAISQNKSLTQEYSTNEILDLCNKQKIKIVAFTYNEPTIWFEFMYDCAKLLKENNIKVVLVTNGYINANPFIALSEYIDAVNIDLKSMSDAFYRQVCSGSVQEVKNTIELCNNLEIHTEITNLVIPNYNDSIRETNALINYIASVNPKMPVHFSKYFPDYLLTQNATPLLTLSQIYHKAMQKLNYVYLGNVKGYSNTICPTCKTTLVYRKDFDVNVTGIRNGRCKNCEEKIYGKFI